MKIYRCLASVFTLAAFLFAGAPAARAVCYADAARGAGQYIDAQMDLEEEQEREIYMLQMALSAGLQTLDAHQYTDSLTEQDKEILNLLNVKIPAIINKIQNNSREVEEELTAASEELARKIIANQNLYPEPKDWETATGFAAMAAVSYAMANGSINEQVTEILVNESLDIMMSAFSEEGLAE